MELVMKGKEFYNLCIQKAIKWNRGKIPYVGIRLNFVFNEMEGKIVIDEKELKKRLNHFDKIDANGMDYFNLVREIMGIRKKEADNNL